MVGQLLAGVKNRLVAIRHTYHSPWALWLGNSIISCQIDTVRFDCQNGDQKICCIFPVIIECSGGVIQNWKPEGGSVGVI